MLELLMKILKDTMKSGIVDQSIDYVTRLEQAVAKTGAILAVKSKAVRNT
jgi:hypothetical protein